MLILVTSMLAIFLVVSWYGHCDMIFPDLILALNTVIFNQCAKKKDAFGAAFLDCKNSHLLKFNMLHLNLGFQFNDKCMRYKESTGDVMG